MSSSSDTTYGHYTDDELSYGSDSDQDSDERDGRNDQVHRGYNPHPGVMAGGDFEHLKSLVRDHNYSLAIKRLCVIRVRRLGEPQRCLFSLRYNTVGNVYESSSMDLSWPGWQSLIYRADNVCRHTQEDTTFLSRFESCPTDRVGRIQWRFDMLELDQWDRIEVEVGAKLFPDTAVALKLVGQGCQHCHSEDTVKLKVNHRNIVTRRNFQNSGIRYLDLVATLKGGDSQADEAWKTPQLFSQKNRSDQNNRWSFTFRIFKD